jgi:hypothetical protein
MTNQEKIDGLLECIHDAQCELNEAIADGAPGALCESYRMTILQAERQLADFNARDEYFRNRQKQAARAEIQEYLIMLLTTVSVIGMIVKVAVS